MTSSSMSTSTSSSVILMPMQGEGTSSAPQSSGTIVPVEPVVDTVVVSDFAALTDFLAAPVLFILFSAACIFGALLGKSINWFKW